MGITVLIADDHEIVSSGIASLIDRVPDMSVVGSAHDGRTAVAEALRLHPTVVLMDINMAGMNGIDATWRIMGEAPEIKVIALSMSADSCYVDRMMDAGACGYLPKSTSMSELVEAIRCVVDGGIYMGRNLAHSGIY